MSKPNLEAELLGEEEKRLNNSREEEQLVPLVRDTCWRSIKGLFNMNSWFDVRFLLITQFSNE